MTPTLEVVFSIGQRIRVRFRPEHAWYVGEVIAFACYADHVEYLVNYAIENGQRRQVWFHENQTGV